MKNLSAYKAPIVQHVNAYFEGWACRTNENNRWSTTVGERLRRFTVDGKLLRGCMVCMASDMFSVDVNNDAAAVGAALEMVQSALLIHDDIMDRASVRRGNPSTHAQYEMLARERRLEHPERFGEAMAICTGDIAFFMASDILTSLPHTPDAVKVALLHTFNSELLRVGLAQMEDVFLEVCDEEPSREEIIEQYRQKTARYTFSLPLSLGGMLAGAPEDILARLTRLGETMGILFQIVDDGLDILRTTEQIGKSAGSDVSSNKKTLHRLALFEASTPEQQDRLRMIFGQPELTPEQLAEVQQLFHESGAARHIETLKRELADDATRTIEGLKVGTEGRKLLNRLLAYLIEREL